jgi:hypothetical protein
MDYRQDSQNELLLLRRNCEKDNYFISPDGCDLALSCYDERQLPNAEVRFRHLQGDADR